MDKMLGTLFFCFAGRDTIMTRFKPLDECAGDALFALKRSASASFLSEALIDEDEAVNRNKLQVAVMWRDDLQHWCLPGAW
eukprot:SAG11_NODE_2155_length_3735_cov_2.677668_3_plen_81_part_00